jgi:hypothetical protein
MHIRDSSIYKNERIKDYPLVEKGLRRSASSNPELWWNAKSRVHLVLFWEAHNLPFSLFSKHYLRSSKCLRLQNNHLNLPYPSLWKIWWKIWWHRPLKLIWLKTMPTVVAKALIVVARDIPLIIAVTVTIKSTNDGNCKGNGGCPSLTCPQRQSSLQVDKNSADDELHISDNHP